MVQVNTFKSHNVLIAIAAVVLIALAGVGLPRLTSTGTPAVSAVHAQIVLARPTVVSAVTPGTCGAGAYISGDMVGEASPAAVYTTMCSSR
jgi:hypothetical protein